MKNREKINQFILIFLGCSFLILIFIPFSTITLRTYDFPNCYTDQIQEFRISPFSPGWVEKHRGDCEEFFNTFWYKEWGGFGGQIIPIDYGVDRINPGFIWALIIIPFTFIRLRKYHGKSLYIGLICLSVSLLFIVFLFFPKLSSDWHYFQSWQTLQVLCTHTPPRCPLRPALVCVDHMYKFAVNVRVEAAPHRPEMQEECSKISEKNSMFIPPGCKTVDCSIVSFPPPQIRSELEFGFYFYIIWTIILLLYGLINLIFWKPWMDKKFNQ